MGLANRKAIPWNYPSYTHLPEQLQPLVEGNQTVKKKSMTSRFQIRLTQDGPLRQQTEIRWSSLNLITSIDLSKGNKPSQQNPRFPDWPVRSKIAFRVLISDETLVGFAQIIPIGFQGPFPYIPHRGLKRSRVKHKRDEDFASSLTFKFLLNTKSQLL